MASDDNVKITLAEYNTLRQEILGRLQSQSQTFAQTIVIIGGVITLIAAILRIDGASLEQLTPALALLAIFAPLVLVPLSMIFFDNEIMIFTLGKYIGTRLAHPLQKAEPDSLPCDVVSSMDSLTKWMQLAVSLGRWVVFVVPVFLCIWFAAQHLGDISLPALLRYILLAFDVALFVLFLAAIVLVAYFQYQWKWRKMTSPRGRSRR